MNITLQAITRDNLRGVINLAVREDQRGFVAANAASIAQAYVEPLFVPLAICAGDTPVGFVMYGRDPETGGDWIIRLMVDAAHQGNGYARAATAAVIERIKAQPDAREINLSYVAGNQAAASLYASFGFEPIGEEDNQILARLTLRATG